MDGGTDVSRELPLFRPEAVEAARSRLGSPVRPVGVASWVLTLFFLTILVTVAVFVGSAQYSRRESVIGVLEPSAGALRVTSTKPGVISEVYVREGQTVKAGSPIATLTLDSTVKGGASLGGLLEAASKEQSAALVSEAHAHALSIQQQRQEIAAKRQGLIEQKERLAGDLKLQEDKVKLQEQTVAGAQELIQKKFFSEWQLRQLQASLIEARQGVSSIQKQEEDDSATMAELVAQDARLAADADESAAQTRASGAQVAEKRASYSAERQVILTAPKAGRVVSLQAKPGEALQTAAAVAVIMPEGAKLEADLWAPSRAAGFARPGDQVRLLFDAFPYQRFGAGHGRVLEVSHAPVPPNELPVTIETHEALYRVTVALDRQDVSAYGQSWPLAPGMRLTGDLVLESRSFLQWILDPLLAMRRRAA